MAGNKGNGNRRMRTPFSARLKSLLRRFVPLVVWIGALVALIVLVREHVPSTEAVGVVEGRDAAITPLVDGRIQAIAVELFEPVREGDVVALLDDGLLQAERRMAQVEVARLRAELEAQREDMTRRSLNDLRRFEVDEERLRLELLDRIVAHETDRVTLVRLAILLERQERLFREGAGSQDLYDAARLEHDALAKKMEENEKAIAFARQSVNEAKRREEKRAQEVSEGSDSPMLDRLRRAIEVQEAQIRMLAEQAKGLVLRAPMSGIVSSVNVGVGQNVIAGTELVSITDPEPTRVQAWVEATAIPELKEGAPVMLYSRRRPRVVVQAKVLKVGARIERFPLRLRPNPNLPLWGVSVLVGQIPSGSFHSGEVLDVRFSGANNGRGS
ncbi:MAG TPA: HlyD family efflux transporter periplasmic adaptor subunit [Sumerlaeia bacterium]|nr:HlyD family efflux transporter periplasmic adaptor subunit [Sumerlaeia bacterium]